MPPGDGKCRCHRGVSCSAAPAFGNSLSFLRSFFIPSRLPVARCPLSLRSLFSFHGKITGKRDSGAEESRPTDPFFFGKVVTRLFNFCRLRFRCPLPSSSSFFHRLLDIVAMKNSISPLLGSSELAATPPLVALSLSSLFLFCSFSLFFFPQRRNGRMKPSLKSFAISQR